MIASHRRPYAVAQDSAAAATNMNNLLNAVISSTSQERFAKEGYDLAGSILAATKSGKAVSPSRRHGFSQWLQRAYHPRRRRRGSCNPSSPT